MRVNIEDHESDQVALELAEEEYEADSLPVVFNYGHSVVSFDVE